METLGASNKRIKLLASLSRKSARYKEGLVFLEGERLVADSARFGAQIVSAFYREGYTGDTVAADEEFILPANVFDRLTDTVTPQGICAAAKMPRDFYASLDSSGSDMLVLCDNVRDPGNLGTIIRSAHAFGAGTVLVTEGCTDPFGLKCVRASMGSVYAVGIARVDTEKLTELRRKGWRIAAGILADNCTELPASDLSGRVIVTVGSEADGVSDFIKGMCDSALKIPMHGGAESFNAAVAASIMMYEKIRQNF